VALPLIDITVGMGLPKIGDFRINVSMPRIGDSPVGMKMHKIGDTEIGKKIGAHPPHPTKGNRIDAMA